MRKTLIPAFLLLLGSALLGATVFHEPLAHAAQSIFISNDSSNPVPVQEQRTDAGGNIKVHEQGTADVNVSSVAPVTGGGGGNFAGGGETKNLSGTVIASAVSIHMSDGVVSFDLKYQGARVASFFGPGGSGGGPSNVELALTRPIKFDSIHCNAFPSAQCLVGWVGAQP